LPKLVGKLYNSSFPSLSEFKPIAMIHKNYSMSESEKKTKVYLQQVKFLKICKDFDVFT